MKFLLAVSVNHQELKEKIVNHFADIGEQFKIVDHYIRLFPEAEMVEHVTGVYDQFATFLRLSVEWCRENALGKYADTVTIRTLKYSSLVKFFKNVALPYEARIKPTIDELNKCMTRVKERVDVHNTHAIAGIQYTLNALIDGLVGEKKLQVDAYATIGPLLQGFASDQRRLLDMADEQAKVRAIGNNIQSHPKASSAMLLADFQDLTTVSDQVKQCAIQSMHLEARYSYLALNLLDMVEVKTWLESDDSTLLWVNGFAYPQAGKWTTEFSIDVMLAVEQRSSIALFYFADVAADEILGSASNYLTSPKAIIHSFIVQLLRRLGDSAPLHSDWTTPKRWEEVCNTTEAAWKFLVFLLHSLSPSHTIVYFVLDSVDVLFNTSKQKHGLSSLLSRLSTLVTSSSSKGGTEECELPVTKVLCTAVGGREYTILFPVEATTSPISHFIAHVPHTFGHHKTLPSPRHLRKPRTRRLVRLPDSDDEFGFKPADSFEFSDEDELDLGSDEKETDLSEKEVRIKKERDTENSNTRGKGSQRSGLGLEKVGGLDSDSSEELEFSDKDSSNIIQREHVADELQFSSEEDDLST